MYEDYMQNMLGYKMDPYQNTYEQYNNQGEKCCYQYNNRDSYLPGMQYRNTMEMNNNMIDLESCYPEIYKIIYPMIKKACMKNTEPITRETIDKMVTEISSNVETGDVINLNINLGNNVGGMSNENREKSSEVNVEEKRKEENRVVSNNFLLNDLIRILLIRELLGRPGGIRPRPPRPPFPPRPPMHRPPIMPRYDDYEMF